ncbi:Alpha/beta hydrolase fold-1 [Hypoxylon argillaceum]|nr:Alpha/beta hydrolase fold-1 [Hypoxylon argillaceum]
MSNKPYILIVTGSFALPSVYDNIVEGVRKHGYDIKAIHLETAGLAPGKGRDTPPATMYDDAALIAKEVETLADQGRKVVLVAHSYGGMPATESTKGLSVQERQKAGKPGGIVRLAYKTVLLASVGKSSIDVLGSIPSGPIENGWYLPGDASGAQLVFSGVPKDEAAHWHSKFACHSVICFTNPLTHAGYKDIPVSYLLCEEDKIISPEIQKREIEMVEKETGSKVDVTSIQTGHCPSISVPETVIGWIVDVAQKS